MAKTKRPVIPIDEAKSIADRLGYDQIIIVGWHKETGTESITTYGNNPEQSRMAAEGGNFVKKALGWPPEKCNAVPKHLKKNNEQFSRNNRKGRYRSYDV